MYIYDIYVGVFVLVCSAFFVKLCTPSMFTEY